MVSPIERLVRVVLPVLSDRLLYPCKLFFRNGEDPVNGQALQSLSSKIFDVLSKILELRD